MVSRPGLKWLQLFLNWKCQTANDISELDSKYSENTQVSHPAYNAQVCQDARGDRRGWLLEGQNYCYITVALLQDESNS